MDNLGELFNKTFQIYKKRIWVFLGIAVIPVLVYLLFIPFFLLPLFFNLSFIAFYKSLGLILLPVTLSIMVILGIIAFVVNLWGSVALLYAIKEREQEIGIKESFAKAWHKIFSYFWVSILTGLIAMAGFLLFIIPGIIFSIWFSLAAYVLVSEDLKGMKALRRSKQLIKGYWFKVFWRFIVLGFLITIIYIVFSSPISFISVLLNIPFAQNITNIINIFITPFSLAFTFLIYENLKQLKGDIKYEY